LVSKIAIPARSRPSHAPWDCPEQLSGTPQIVKTLSMLSEVRRRELDLASNEII